MITKDVSDRTPLVAIRHFRRDHEAPSSCDFPNTTYVNGGELQYALSNLYSLLKQHVRGRPDLALGAVSKGEFLDHWEPDYALPIPANAPTDKAGRRDLVPGHLRLKSIDRVLDEIIQGKKSAPVCGGDSGSQ